MVVKRYLLVALGTFFVIVGIIGLAVPIMPTSPFLLIAAACYARSSDQLYNRLLDNPMFGPMIREWREQGTISRQAKWTAILMIVISFSVSIIFFIPYLWGRILMAFIGFTVALLLYRLPVAH
ncbi:MAG: YbaN family protein [Gammaproteobacteria bacterium]|nr:YbaN family protein [Gammaproteobacteria bacterium]